MKALPLLIAASLLLASLPAVRAEEGGGASETPKAKPSKPRPPEPELVLGPSKLGPDVAGNPYWMTLEKGKRLFRDGDYAGALNRFEDAVREREELFSEARKSFVEQLAKPEVRRLGDNLDRVAAYAEEKRNRSAVEALEALFRARPKASFNNSAKAALDSFEALKSYPEAYFWMAEVFRVEGEDERAADLYSRALAGEAQLEIPAEADEIRYRLAGIAADKRDYPGMEKLLLRIISTDAMWGPEDKPFVRDAMTRAISNEGADRFLFLYRHDATPVQYKAQRDLGLYYYRTGRHDRALRHLAFAHLIAATAAIGELRRGDPDFQYTGFAKTLDRSFAVPELAEYLKETDYCRTVYYLGAALFANGYRSAAAEYWSFLKTRPEAGEWKGRAAKQLAAPYIEKPTQTP